MSIPQDVREFLDNYPDNVDDPGASTNFEFYSNIRRCRPDNRLIDEIHEQWTGDYDKLEYKHGYIQWLFPIQEYGMNYESQPLQRHEIRVMKASPAIIDRIITSYEMMLDFYGMRLISIDSGLVDRSLPPRNFVSRYTNFARSPHNNLRISRILKCLSEFDLEHLSVGFLLHVLWEQSDGRGLNTPGIRSSMDRWWANCLRDDEKRDRVGVLIRKVRNGGDGYVFTRKMYQEELELGGTSSGNAVVASTNVLVAPENVAKPADSEVEGTPADVASRGPGDVMMTSTNVVNAPGDVVNDKEKSRDVDQKPDATSQET